MCVVAAVFAESCDGNIGDVTAGHCHVLLAMLAMTHTCGAACCATMVNMRCSACVVIMVTVADHVAMVMVVVVVAMQTVAVMAVMNDD